MERVKYECTELFCRPKARCFKGISILTYIFAASCLLMLIIIGPVIKAHGDTTVNQNKPGTNEPDAAEVAHRLHIMNASTIWLSVIFTVIGSISLALFFKYKKLEKNTRTTDAYYEVTGQN